MVKIDNTSNLSIHAQLVEGFKNLILSEVLKENEKLPSVRSLASQLIINPNTIHKAYKELEAEGYIESQSGKGMFVKKIQATKSNEFTKELLNNFKDISTKLIHLEIEKYELIEIIKNIWRRETCYKLTIYINHFITI